MKQTQNRILCMYVIVYTVYPVAFTLQFLHNGTSTLRLQMSRDCHARAVLLVKNGSSTIDNRDASLPSMVPRRVAVLLVLLWAFLRLRKTQSTENLQGKKVLA